MSALLAAAGRDLSVRRLISTSCSATRRTWRNETPSGGLTELYVYSPDSSTVWPDPALGVFSTQDPRFGFPGNVGLATSASPTTEEPKLEVQTSNETHHDNRLDVLEQKNRMEHQAQVLYSAHDFIHYTKGAENYVCSTPILLDTFPSAMKTNRLRCELHEAPQLLKRELQPLFPTVPNFTGPTGHGNVVSVITMAQHTENDMSAWSDGMETEREDLTAEFVSVAKEVCGRLKSDGYWADFIDPCAGVPYYGRHTNTTMFETDEKYRLLGFRIEDLGCCKVISHREFGRHVFVGTIFTSAHPSTGIVQEMFKEMQIIPSVASNKSNENTATNECV